MQTCCRHPHGCAHDFQRHAGPTRGWRTSAPIDVIKGDNSHIYHSRRTWSSYLHSIWICAFLDLWLQQIGDLTSHIAGKSRFLRNNSFSRVTYFVSTLDVKIDQFSKSYIMLPLSWISFLVMISYSLWFCTLLLFVLIFLLSIVLRHVPSYLLDFIVRPPPKLVQCTSTGRYKECGSTNKGNVWQPSWAIALKH